MGSTDDNTLIIEVPKDDGAIARALADLDAKISDWGRAMGSAQSALARFAEAERRSEKPADARNLTPTATPSEASPAVEADSKTAGGSGAATQRDQEPVSAKETARTAAPEKKPGTKAKSEASQSAATPKPSEKSQAATPGKTVKLPDKGKPAAEQKGRPPEGKDEAKAPEGGRSFASRFKRFLGADDPELVVQQERPEAKAETPDQKNQTEPATPPPAELDDDETLLASLDPKVAKTIRIKRRLSNGKKSVRELLEEM